MPLHLNGNNRVDPYIDMVEDLKTGMELLFADCKDERIPKRTWNSVG